MSILSQPRSWPLLLAIMICYFPVTAQDLILYSPDHQLEARIQIDGGIHVEIFFRKIRMCTLGPISLETDMGQFRLTRGGMRYCAEHYREFPGEMWFEYIPPPEENIRKVVEKFT